MRLVRNHELRDTPDVGSRPVRRRRRTTTKGPGGNTTLEVRVFGNGRAELVKQFASLTGTSTNCAGGGTPWRTWISSEETVAGKRAGWGRNHGYNFEVHVDSDGISRRDAAQGDGPVRSRGRRGGSRRSGYVYQTEDRTPSGFYRFKPDTYGQARARRGASDPHDRGQARLQHDDRASSASRR